MAFGLAKWVDYFERVAALPLAPNTLDPDKLVDALEKTDYVGTIGRVQFKGKDSPNPHALKVGPDTITGLMLQWQDGKQVAVWPSDVAKGQMKFPSFIKLGSAN